MSKYVVFAKVRLAVLRDLFSICWVIQSPIFCDFGKWGHFRTARSGVYIGLRCICKWSRSLRESSGIHVYSIRRIENSKWVKSGFLQSFSGWCSLGVTGEEGFSRFSPPSPLVIFVSVSLFSSCRWFWKRYICTRKNDVPGSCVHMRLCAHAHIVIYTFNTI